MIHLNTYITEKLKINKDTKVIEYHPKTGIELCDLLDKLIKERGENADLNDIDVSKITNMSYVFYYSKFNGDISEWDVSNVEDMRNMFRKSLFNGDISNWDVSNVRNMDEMFYDSTFNQDISKWNVNKNCSKKRIFKNCPLQKNPPTWYEEN